jgi:hypothetical protein
MGVQNFEMWDDDVVAEENLFPGGFFDNDLGEQKVDVSFNDLRYALDVPRDNIFPISRRFTPDEMPVRFEYDIVLTCPDTLKARREHWERFHELEIDWRLWIDARMGGATASVFSVLDSDEDAKLTYNTELEGGEVELPCGEKATSMLTVGFIPGMIAQSVRDYLMGVEPVYWQQYDGDARTLQRFKV